VLDDITLYWLAESATSSARLYWENGGRNVVAAAYRPPETWARALSQPDLLPRGRQGRTLRGLGALPDVADWKAYEAARQKLFPNL